MKKYKDYEFFEQTTIDLRELNDKEYKAITKATRALRKLGAEDVDNILDLIARMYEFDNKDYNNLIAVVGKYRRADKAIEKVANKKTAEDELSDSISKVKFAEV